MSRTLHKLLNSFRCFWSVQNSVVLRSLPRCLAVTLCRVLFCNARKHKFRLCLAVPLFTTATVFADKQQDEEDPEIIKIMKLAVLSMQRDELDKAEQLLHISLRLAQERANASAVSYIYSLLAEVAVRRGRPAHAEPLLLHLARRLAATHGSNSNAFVEVSLKLAAVHAAAGDDERADVGFRFCVDTQQRKVDAAAAAVVDEGGDVSDDTLALWGMAADHYSQYLAERGQVSRARPMAATALDVSQRLSGDAGQQTLVLLSQLARLDALAGDVSLAAERLHTAVRLARLHAHPQLAVFQVNLGLVLLQQRLLAEAERACATALRRARRDDDPETVRMAGECLQEVKALL